MAIKIFLTTVVISLITILIPLFVRKIENSFLLIVWCILLFGSISAMVITALYIIWR